MSGKTAVSIILLFIVWRLEHAEMTSRKYSDYYEGLEKNVQGRYRFKLGLVGQNLHDPYTFEPDPDSTDAMPEIKSNKYT